VRPGPVHRNLQLLQSNLKRMHVVAARRPLPNNWYSLMLCSIPTQARSAAEEYLRDLVKLGILPPEAAAAALSATAKARGADAAQQPTSHPSIAPVASLGANASRPVAGDVRSTEGARHGLPIAAPSTPSVGPSTEAAEATGRRNQGTHTHPTAASTSPSLAAVAHASTAHAPTPTQSQPAASSAPASAHQHVQRHTSTPNTLTSTAAIGQPPMPPSGPQLGATAQPPPHPPP